MHIQHFEKDLHYTDREFLIIARKLGSMATHCKRLKDDSSFIRIEAEKRDTKKKQDAFKVMINVSLPGKSLRAECRAATVMDAVDAAVAKLDPQLKKYKELHTRKGLRSASRSR